MLNASSTAAGQMADKTDVHVMAESLVYEIQFHTLWLNFIFLIQKQREELENPNVPLAQGG